MDHRCPWLLGQLADGDQGGHCRRRDRITALVDHEAAVGVAVEREPDVRADLAHLGLQVDQVLRVERVRLVVRKRAVELEVHRDDSERQAVEHGRHGVPGHAVPGVDHDGQRPDVGQIDQAPEVRA